MNKFKIREKEIETSVSFKDLKAIKHLINKCLNPNFVSLYYTGDVLMESIAFVNPFWQLDDKQKTTIDKFYNELPNSISRKEFKGFYQYCLKFLETFKASMLEGGK